MPTISSQQVGVGRAGAALYGGSVTLLREYTVQVGIVDPSVFSIPCLAMFSDGSPDQEFDAFLHETFTMEDGAFVTLVGAQVNAAGISPMSNPVTFFVVQVA